MAHGISAGLQLTVAAASAAPTYAAEATALFARMAVQPPEARKVQLNTLINSLKTAGVWAKLTALWVMAQHDSNSARLNLVSAAYQLVPSGLAPDSPVAQPLFTPDKGYKGNGVDSYIQTGLLGIDLSLTSSHIGVFVYEGPTQGTMIEIGARTSSRIVEILSKDNAGNLTGRAFSSGIGGTPIATAVGHSVVTRVVPESVDIYKNGALAATLASPVTASTAFELFLLASNNGGAVLAPSTRGLAAAHAGAGLTAANDLALYNALNTYLTAVGALA